MKSIVLLIDDDPIDIKSTELLLKSWSFEIITARSGREGLEKLQTATVDLVISDVRMPEMSGVDVVKSVTDLYPDIPVVLVTAHGDIRSAVEAM
ncbi:MAG: response regulator, partial [Kiritimatiellae bacterium]|nr:response regulator [Kiritimatiellia bacterium]